MDSKTEQAKASELEKSTALAKSFRDKAEKDKIEIISTIILSLAALAAAWCGYQSTLWDGIQTFKLADMNGSYRNAEAKNIIIMQHQTVDADMIMNFVNAYAEKNESTLNFYLNRTRPEFRKILRAWIELDKTNAPDLPPHPMATAEYQELYKNRRDSVDLLRKQAHNFYMEANTANRISDKYVMLTVFFSLILFLGALSTQIDAIKPKKVLVGMSVVLCFCLLLYLTIQMPYTPGG